MSSYFRANSSEGEQSKMASIVKKLGLKPDMRVLVVAAPSGYMRLLAPLPEGVTVSERIGGTNDFVQFFATRKSEIEKSAKKLLQSSASGALVWITYPKKTSGMESDLSREEVWAAMEGTGWRPVTQIAIDDVWSALRFRPAADVKRR
jgi:hypothetical protein